MYNKYKDVQHTISVYNKYTDVQHTISAYIKWQDVQHTICESEGSESKGGDMRLRIVQVNSDHAVVCVCTLYTHNVRGGFSVFHLPIHCRGRIPPGGQCVAVSQRTCH